MKENKNQYRILYFLTIVTSVIYIVWRIFFTLPFGYGIISVIVGIALVVSELVGMIEGLEHCIGMTRKMSPEMPEVEEKDFPHVDVFISTYNESEELLYKTVNGCKHMEYPDSEKVHIYLCDDGNRKEMKQLAEKMQIGYITRETNENAKAGNLNNAISLTDSPLIATFDADMIPLHDFLLSTVPYFFRQEKVGFIQTPQSFYNADLFQYNLYSETKLPNEQDYFFRDVNVGRNSTNSPIYAGSNTVISRQALADVGGIAIGVITEDFATGIKIQEQGYACYAIDEVHAIGLAPGDFKSLVKQRERWARGCVQTFKKIKLWTNTKLSLGQKMGYTSCLLYWYTYIRRLIYILAPILFSVFGINVVKCSLWELALFWFPSYFFNNRTIKLLSGNLRTTRWSNIYDTILMPSLIIPVLLETFGIKQKKFVVTEKSKQKNDKIYQYKKAVWHVILAVFSVIGLYNMIRATLEGQTIGFIVIIFWLGINFYNIMMSIFFMLSRTSYRMSERFYVNLPAAIEGEGKVYRVITKDISDGGFSFSAEEPLYFKPEHKYQATLKGKKFDAFIDVEIMQVKKQKDSWHYGVKIVSMDEENKSKYFRIIYDREPTLPKSIASNLSVFDDVYINIHKRMEGDHSSKRKLPRLKFRANVNTKEYGKVQVKDFNFEYAAVLTKQTTRKNPENLTFLLGNAVTIRCKWEADKGGGIGLYKIENLQEFVNTAEFASAIQTWSKDYEMEKNKEKAIKKMKEKQDYRMNEMEYL